jgi:HSP20 family protein|tara:strand:+ start:463 stop:951 length:489 start_codon:yes stop_codon:yes gene_type:complete
MTSLIRYPHALAPRTLSRNEWLTPFDRLFDDMFGNMFPTVSSDVGEDFFAKGAYPKVNVINNEESVCIEAAIPGMTKEEVTVEVSDGILTIQGTSNQRADVDNGQYVKREIKRSAFQRSFRLGENLDDTAIQASCDNGILCLTIPKVVPTAEEHTVRKIDIV